MQDPRSLSREQLEEVVKSFKNRRTELSQMMGLVVKYKNDVASCALRNYMKNYLEACPADCVTGMANGLMVWMDKVIDEYDALTQEVDS